MVGRYQIGDAHRKIDVEIFLALRSGSWFVGVEGEGGFALQGGRWGPRSAGAVGEPFFGFVLNS